MNIEAYDADSLRKMVRLLEYENKILKDKLKKAGISYEEVNPFEEKIESAEEYDLDQGSRIVNPPYITEKMAIRFFSMFWGREDVYARRGKNGGYFPQCANRWNDRLCPKQRKEKIFCDECENTQYNLISTSKVRNEMIIDDVITCVARKQTPVILTRFKEHAKFLHDALKEKADHVFLLYGDNSDKENAEIRVKLKQIPENESLILVATGQKIGEGFDFPRLDVLMLAAPVSFEGRLEQYVGRLNRDYVGKEAVYVYDYIDSHVRYFDKMYAKRLRTYRKMGFSIWTQELQPKQIINAIFDSVNYTEKFEQDIVESEKMVVISSPDIRQDKIDRFLLLIKKRQEVGVKVTVITTDPEDITYGKSDVCHELIRAMQLVGINVITRTEVEECFAVIDDEIVWHGGMNLLGKADVWDNLMRIRNPQVATELLEIALEYSEARRKSE